MRALWLIPLTLFVDQTSKLIVESRMVVYRDSISVIGDFFRLTYIQNKGAAFGLTLGSPELHTVISILALGVLIWMFLTLPRNDRLLRIALLLVLGGALGNIIDRFRLNAVIDFFDFGIGLYRWPVFNFADSFVTVGIGLLALGYSRSSAAKPESTASATEPTSQTSIPAGPAADGKTPADG